MIKRKKVLVIRFSSIGDMVLTSPVVRCLKGVVGLDLEVHYATKKIHAGIMEANPHVDMVHALEGSLWDLIKHLRAEKFDYVIDLHNNLRSNLIRLALAKKSRGFYKLNVQKWLMTRFKMNRLPPLHIVDRYLAAARGLGVENDGKGLDYFIPESDRGFPPALPKSFRTHFIAFGIGGKHATKRMPNEQIEAVCRGLNRPVVLLGGKEDFENGQAIQLACGPRVFNACGLFSLNQSAYLIKASDAVVTHDTGLMHIAAAFQKPVVSIWGNTVPEFGMAPYMPEKPGLSEIIEVKDLPCRPCSKIGYSKCPKGHFDCMTRIDTREVLNRLKKQGVS